MCRSCDVFGASSVGDDFGFGRAIVVMTSRCGSCSGGRGELTLDTNIALETLRDYRDFDGAQHLVDIPGLSSPRVCNFLNRLVARMDADEHYLEVGTWKGRTLLSAAFHNFNRLCIGCDRFRFWGRFTGPGFIARRALYANIRRYALESAKVELYDMPSRRLFSEAHVRSPVGVYFYDGDHSYEETFHGIMAAVPFLSPKSVLLIDDFNDPIIRCATREAIDAAKLRLLWQRELPGNQDEIGWWNGLGVFFVAR